jgi:hypothetical protein
LRAIRDAHARGGLVQALLGVDLGSDVALLLPADSFTPFRQ